ncbi:MAG: hypothetical protein M1822_005343, partial [Bathelium mastoideum]
STLRKVNRKDIQAVNVKKACETIVTPTAPMALRLQSNLLYGVSRVHSQQCTYVLTDAQNAQQNIHALFKVVHTAQLDPEAGRARLEQLTLRDDPAFLPDLALAGPSLDAALFDLSTSAGSRRTSSVLSLSTALTEPSPVSPGGFVGGLDIPSSSAGGPLSMGGLGFPADEGPESMGLRPSEPRQYGEEESVFPEPDFLIDADGNFIELSAQEQTHRPRARSQGSPSTPQPRFASNTSISMRSRPSREGQTIPQTPQAMEEDVQLPIMDDFGVPPNVQSVSDSLAAGPGPQPPSSGAIEEFEDTSSEARAPQRRHRQPKAIPVDPVLELRNADLVLWDSGYLSTMAKVWNAKTAAKAARRAKENAEAWIIGRGLGNVGWGFGQDHAVKNPLLADLFSGEALWERITGIKRRHETIREASEPDGADAENRRVRPRGEEGDQIGRGETMEFDHGLRFGGEEDVELPREAPSVLDVHLSDTMPWNITASLRHSSVPLSAGAGGPFATYTGPSSAGLPSSIGAPTRSRGRGSRAGSRIVSASPLVGRGLGLPLDPSVSAASAQEQNQDQEADPLVGVGADNQFALPTSGDLSAAGSPTFGGEVSALDELGAAADMQMAARPQWMGTVLDAESENFLDFLRTGVRGRLQEREQYLGHGEEESIPAENVMVRFEELLPPRRNTRLVAASGLLHVLSLASRGSVNVRQVEAFGDIEISIPGEL